MKKIIFLFVILAISIFGLAFIINNTKILNPNPQPNKTIIYKLNGKEYKLLVADRSDLWAKGLMEYRKLDQADGMIFLFPNKEYQKFWNKNTYLNLDIYWLDDVKVVSQDILPSIEKSRDVVVVSSPQPVNRVIEIVKK